MRMGFSSCGTGAHLWQLEGSRAWVQDLLGPGIKPMSPVLAGRFLSTVSPAKSSLFYFKTFLGRPTEIRGAI